MAASQAAGGRDGQQVSQGSALDPVPLNNFINDLEERISIMLKEPANDTKMGNILLQTPQRKKK